MAVVSWAWATPGIAARSAAIQRGRMATILVAAADFHHAEHGEKPEVPLRRGGYRRRAEGAQVGVLVVLQRAFGQEVPPRAQIAPHLIGVERRDVAGLAIEIPP